MSQVVKEKLVNADWTVEELLSFHPQAGEVLSEWGIHCAGCSVGGVETLKEAGKLHGMSSSDMTQFLTDINDALNRPQSQGISITTEAALRLLDVMKKQTKAGGVLSVQMDEEGKFSLELKQNASGEKVFRNSDVPEIAISASTQTLQRIGGSEIRLKNGRFTLEMPGKCACGKATCKCTSSGKRSAMSD